MSKLPDYKAFQLLFNKWKAMMQAQLKHYGEQQNYG